MKDLILYFLNQQNKKVGLRIPAARADVTAQECSVVMDSVIARNIFSTSGGDLVSKHSAQLVERTVQLIDVLN